LRGHEATFTELGSLPFLGENRDSIPLGSAIRINKMDDFSGRSWPLC
jgi:hypothetical protein